MHLSKIKRLFLNIQNAKNIFPYGLEDNIVPVQQSIELADKLKSAVGEKNIVLRLVEGAGHGGEMFESAENVALIFDFLDEHLR